MTAFGVAGVPIVSPGDDLSALILKAIRESDRPLRDHDIVVVTSKVVSRSEGRFVDLADVVPSERAIQVACEAGGDARFVELVLRESVEISRIAQGAIIARHRCGFVVANAGIDRSNVGRSTEVSATSELVLLLPEDSDASARAIRAGLMAGTGRNIAVVISDSFGRPFRMGTVGVAIGVAGLPPLWDRRGDVDLFGRSLQHTVTALADQVAATADLLAGQADEARPVIVVRGIQFRAGESGGARDLVRPASQDLYARAT